jgi:hypothetical protein
MLAVGTAFRQSNIFIFIDLPTSTIRTLGEESPFGVISPDATSGICLIYGLEKYSHL